MKIVIDTNVFISATFWDGPSEKVIAELESRNIKLILSRAILKEFARVLQYDEIQNKIKDKDLEMKYTLQKIASLSKIVEPSQKIRVVTDDPDDDKFIEAAVEGKCEYIVSNDKHLLNLRNYKQITIVKPEEFLTLLRYSKGHY